jgi:hypothetical protein
VEAIAARIEYAFEITPIEANSERPLKHAATGRIRDPVNEPSGLGRPPPRLG